MSSIMKVFLLLAAVMFCISEAQQKDLNSCLCHRTRDKLASRNSVKDIQIYQKTLFCNKVEIVVTYEDGHRFCLTPKPELVTRLMARVMNSRTTAAPSTDSSSPQ